MLLKGVQARLQSMKHRDGAIGLLSELNQLVDDPFLPSDTILGDRDVSLGLGEVVLLTGVVHGGKCPLALAGQRRAHGRELFLFRRVDLRVSEIEARHCLHDRRGDEKPAEPLVVGRYDEPWRVL
jgi:hypothetical protein